MSGRGLSLRRITGHCTVAGDRVTAWYRLAPQGWSFRPDTVREQLIVDTADALAQLSRRNLHLRVTTRPYPVSRWAAAHDANAPAPLPGWPDHLIRDQLHLASRSMADKEVYLGVDLGTSRPLLHALSGLAPRRVRAGTEFRWVTPHTYRKTVATLLDSQGASARMIADQLGHSRISMTQDVYMGRRAVSPEIAAALESLDEDQRPRGDDEIGR